MQEPCIIWKTRNQIPRIMEYGGQLCGGNCCRDVNDLNSSSQLAPKHRSFTLHLTDEGTDAQRT